VTTKSDENELLRSVALQNATSILMARQRAERRSETYLAEAQRLSHTGSFGWRPSTGEIFWSDETFRIFQYDRTTVPSVELILERTHPEDAASVRRTVERASQDGEDFEHEYRLLMPDGSVKHVHVVAHAETDEAGEREFVGAVMDISERKMAEVLLAGEKQLLEMIARGDSRDFILKSACLLVEELASGSLTSILLFDPNGNCLRHGAAPSLPSAYNKAIDGILIGPSVGSCGTAAYRAEPVIVADIATDPLWAPYRDLALAHGLRACWSTPILSSARKVLGTFATYYRETRKPNQQEHNVIERITHLMSIAIERELAEETLRRSENYLAEAQRLTHTASWAWRLAGKTFLHLSEEWYRIYDFDPEKGLPAWEEILQRIHPGDRAKWQSGIDRATQEKSHYEMEYRILLPSGRVKYIKTVGHPVLDASGNLVQFVGSATDITERKRAEEERERLRQVQADLAHVSRVTTMGELTASLAHEVNQPIAAAVTNANTCLRWLARDSPDVEEARAAATRIIKDGTRAAEIVGRIRLLYKKGTPQCELIDINEVIRDMIVLLRGESTRYNIVVGTDLAPDLARVRGDRVQLQQVLMNLMINGIDAMKDADGARELKIRSQQTEGEGVMVSVTDSGIGLPKQADRIFDAFFTTKPHGTGMGLRISRSIIESHGGRLRAANNSPRGASFCFTLPTKAEA
jgi:PAS domain S-box-containing protein